MISDIAYTMVIGFPLFLWTGMVAMTLLVLAMLAIGLTQHTKIKISIGWHKWLALAGLLAAVIHAILAMSVFIPIF